MDYEVVDAQAWHDPPPFSTRPPVQAPASSSVDFPANRPSHHRIDSLHSSTPQLQHTLRCAANQARFTASARIDMRSTSRIQRSGYNHVLGQLLLPKSMDFDTQRQRYCQEPPSYSLIQAIGTYHWPDPELKPEQCFGSGLRMLDHIRMMHSCWIIYDSSPLLQVLGVSVAHVKTALCRIRASFDQARAWKSDCIILRLIKPIPESDMESLLEVVPYKAHRVSLLPRVALKFSCEKCVNSALSGESTQQIKQENVVIFGGAFKSAWNRAILLPGLITLKAQYGKFSLTSYNRDVKSVTALKDMLDDPRCGTDISSSIEDAALEAHLLHRFARASETTGFKGADTPKPAYGAVFIFRSRDQKLGLGSILSLSVEYEVNRLGEFDRIASQWSLAGTSADHPRLLDVSMINISKSMAWNIIISGGPAIDPLPHPMMLDFESSIKFREIDIPGTIRADRGCESFLRFVPRTELEVVSVQELLIYKFKLIRSTFTCEVRYSQDRVEPSICTNPNWSVNVMSNEWDEMLSRNIDLAIGERTEVFPNTTDPTYVSGETIEEFMQSMDVVEDIIHRS